MLTAQHPLLPLGLLPVCLPKTQGSQDLQKTFAPAKWGVKSIPSSTKFLVQPPQKTICPKPGGGPRGLGTFPDQLAVPGLPWQGESPSWQPQPPGPGRVPHPVPGQCHLALNLGALLPSTSHALRPQPWLLPGPHPRRASEEHAGLIFFLKQNIFLYPQVFKNRPM